MRHMEKGDPKLTLLVYAARSKTQRRVRRARGLGEPESGLLRRYCHRQESARDVHGGVWDTKRLLVGHIAHDT